MSDSLGDQCCQSIFPCVLDLPEYYVAHGLGSLLLTLTISLARPIQGVKKGVGTEEQRKRKRNGSRSTRTFFFFAFIRLFSFRSLSVLHRTVYSFFSLVQGRFE